ncbi:MAG: hypothetical protein V1900_01965 [Candidatus Aenigmatarchaeota archaeon]
MVSKRIVFEICVLVLLVVILSWQFLPRFIEEKAEKPNVMLDDVFYVSDSDSTAQEKIKNVTGCDWSCIIDADGEQKGTAIFLLASEMSVIEKQYEYVNKSFGISDEWDSLNLNEIGTSRSKENVIKMIDGMVEIESFFDEKGLTEDARINRLNFLKYYFSEYGLPEGEINSEENAMIKDILGLSGSDIDSYGELISILIIRYNIFLRSV